MPKLAKKRAKVDEAVDRTRKYTVEEACALVKKASFAKFDETVDIAVRLGRQPEARRSDGPRRARAAARHRPDGPRPRLRQGREGSGGRGGRRRLRRRATTWSRRSRKASWTSTA